MIRRYLTFAFILCFALVADAAELRKYGVGTTLYFPLLSPTGVDFVTTPAVCDNAGSGDVRISKDGGAFAEATNCFAHLGLGIYSLGLSAAEMQAARIVIIVKDQTATKVWLDDSLSLDTYGHASAQHAFDLDSEANLTQQRAIFFGVVNGDDFGPSVTQFEGDLRDSTGAPANVATVDNPTADNHFNRRIIIFTSGALYGQATTIADFLLENGRGKFTVTATTEAASAGDTFVIL